MDKSVTLTIWWGPETKIGVSVHPGVKVSVIEDEWLRGYDSESRQVLTVRLSSILAWGHEERLVPFPGEMLPTGPQFEMRKP